MKHTEFIIGRKILNIGNRLQCQRNKDVEVYGITGSQADALLYFDGNDNMTVTDLKTHLQISHQAARKIVEQLKAKGYLYTVISPADARSHVVLFTEEGRAFCEELKRDGNIVGAKLLQGFSPAEKEIFIQLIKKMEDNL